MIVEFNPTGAKIKTTRSVTCKPNNYSSFYGHLNRMYAPDKEELKKSIVLQYTSGRTDSLCEVTLPEYTAMLKGMRVASGQDAPEQGVLRRKRSAVLRQMQLYGVDTTDWTKINAFCRDARIAGKAFGSLSADELDRLSVKLRAIQRKKNSCESPRGSQCQIIPLYKFKF